MRVITNSAEETERAGQSFAESLKLPEDGSSLVVALYGGLGAGKTAFVRGMALGLGITQSVTSPTFSIINEYAGKPPLFHFDMYRLSSEDELFDIGWDEYLTRGGVIAVEWSERVERAFEPGTVRVEIESTGESSRVIEIKEDKL